MCLKTWSNHHTRCIRVRDNIYDTFVKNNNDLARPLTDKGINFILIFHSQNEASPSSQIFDDECFLGVKL